MTRFAGRTLCRLSFFFLQLRSICKRRHTGSIFFLSYTSLVFWTVHCVLILGFEALSLARTWRIACTMEVTLNRQVFLALLFLIARGALPLINGAPVPTQHSEQISSNTTPNGSMCSLVSRFGVHLDHKGFEKLEKCANITCNRLPPASSTVISKQPRDIPYGDESNLVTDYVTIETDRNRFPEVTYDANCHDKDTDDDPVMLGTSPCACIIEKDIIQPTLHRMECSDSRERWLRSEKTTVHCICLQMKECQSDDK